MKNNVNFNYNEFSYVLINGNAADVLSQYSWDLRPVRYLGGIKCLLFKKGAKYEKLGYEENLNRLAEFLCM